MPIVTSKPNENVNIITGSYILKLGDTSFEILGQITFKWFPSIGVYFTGTSTNTLYKIWDSDEQLKLYIDNNYVGDAHLKRFSMGTKQFEEIEGIVISRAIVGDRTIAVNKVAFSVPNLRDYWDPLEFKNEDYTITINKIENFTTFDNLLKDARGYSILYTGVLTKNRGDILVSELPDLCDCLNMFLSFINGRHTGVIFLQGLHNEKVCWTDYTPCNIETYHPVISWSLLYGIDVNYLWGKFSKDWRHSDSKHYLDYLIHWYLESNNNSRLIEVSIIVAQAALELSYNWLLIEKEKILVGSDANKIIASNKIRLLLSKLGIASEIPKGLNHIHKHAKINKEYLDGPKAIVDIRNAIVHSRYEHRKKLKDIPFLVKYQTLQLCLWYIELSLLYTLDYNGVYFNRCLDAKFEEGGRMTVPWVET